ncbi:MAG: hypothetical protein F6K09_19425 [Merismopedia sp. SIO2A8]|nr:hypothetical protein [Symploca sp. SIO2B6]NET50818.1 hypothetical protein [Merismopedia sp. SIO2A8]
MRNQLENTEQVLGTVRKLVRATNGHGDLTSAASDYVKATSLLPLSKLEYWEQAFSHEIWKGVHSQQSGWGVFSIHRNPFRNRLLLPWLDCCSGDGYQREEAVRAASEGAPNSFIFALLLRRLNDWVPEVRAVAREQISIIATNTKPRHVAEALWVILPYLHTWRRLKDDDLEALINLLSLEDVPSQLASRLIHVTAGPAATVLGQVGRSPVLDSYLPTISEKAIQPSVRAKAYRSQLEERIVWVEGRKWVWTDLRWCQGHYEPILGEREIHVHRSFLETLTRAARDRSSIVRRVAGDTLIANLNAVGVDAIQIARVLSEDPYPSIAERGKFALERLNE